jgi:D-glycero-beta-D-manno-heptose 1-phosphate adenylyltransferase
MSCRFGVIGLGRVGGAMLTLLKEAGHVPVWTVSTRSHINDIPVYAHIPNSPGGVQVVFITVPDSHIRSVAEEINAAWGRSVKDIVFFHFSGLLTSGELAVLSTAGSAIGSLHPLQSITDASQARQILQGSIFTFEGMEGAARVARELVDSIGAVMMTISGEDKVLYHASAVVASNYLVALLHQASVIIEKAGMDLSHLMPLIKGTLSNIGKYGGKALTGPIARGDWATVEGHVKALREHFPDLIPSYIELGRYCARLAEKQFPDELFNNPKLTGLGGLCNALLSKQARGMKVVFTNGCFDIIHAGHVTYLSKARALGDCLVVGLNSDVSVKSIKGPDRPVNNERARAAVLSALACVDHVVLFEEDTPLDLIRRIRPDVLVKGGDWAVDNIVGAEVVRATGGQVLTIPFEDGFSTTAIIERIRQEE